MEAPLSITQEKLQEVLLLAREKGNQDGELSVSHLVEEIKDNLLSSSMINLKETP
ncbi:hypothetical protein [Pseudalkalibacillus hwajinpoensis]|uniref:hypothetical protein n=1 Tax=Guptibacillus hwajinpoensis TaxID=208199 RepID=UPI001CFD459C|nr:hypothetical protein [Pseudalkalibacillus hwajinpoensis]